MSPGRKSSVISPCQPSDSPKVHLMNLSLPQSGCCLSIIGSNSLTIHNCLIDSHTWIMTPTIPTPSSAVPDMLVHIIRSVKPAFKVAVAASCSGIGLMITLRRVRHPPPVISRFYILRFVQDASQAERQKQSAIMKPPLLPFKVQGTRHADPSSKRHSNASYQDRKSRREKPDLPLTQFHISSRHVQWVKSPSLCMVRGGQNWTPERHVRSATLLSTGLWAIGQAMTGFGRRWLYAPCLGAQAQADEQVGE